jgi:hypothetical protein
MLRWLGFAQLVYGAFAVFRSHRAIGYIDPGSGSFIFQILIAIGLGSVLSIKLWWARLAGIFRRGDSKGSDGDVELKSDGSNASVGRSPETDERGTR